MTWQIINADCIAAMKEMPDASIDAIVTDPPYELGFMGKGWDATGIANSVEMWSEVFRVLKPGGHVLSFSGTRTCHRMVCAVEDAGFEIRDQIAWMYGQGMPKGLNVAKGIKKTEEAERAAGWEGWNTQLKPSYEPIVLARKPLVGNVVQNVLDHGTGALNIDGTRVGDSKNVPRGQGNMKSWESAANTYAPTVFGHFGAPSPENSKFNPNIGRWPANVILDMEAAALVDRQQAANVKHIEDVASRFFFCPKITTAERDAGLEDFEEVGVRSANVHPTVKPIELMRWLCRLVTPPGGVVLDPFNGSGSTGCAAVLEGFDYIGIEREAEYVAIAEARIAWWEAHPEGMELVDRIKAEKEWAEVADSGQFDLFGEAT